MPNQLVQCRAQFKSCVVKILSVLHSHINDIEMPAIKRFIFKSFDF